MRKKKTDLRKIKDVLWELCKTITRARHGNRCYTCRFTPLEGSNWHTGHFIPSSTSSVELRYDLDNLRPQCRNCNFWKSGDWPAFEAQLKKDCGEEYVQALKDRNQKTKGLQYDILWYKDKVAEYELLANELK